MHNAIVVDLERCIGCFGCEISCKMENNVALGEYWNKVIVEGPYGTFPDIEQYWLPTMCQQCADAPCVHVCPTGASYRDENNVVLIDKSVCIGCKYCMMACPYGVRNWNQEQQVVEKCTLCQHLTQQGKEPACVHNCPGEARFYGDLDDPNSDVSKALAAADPADVHRLRNVGNNPSTAYILSSKYATWRNGD
ncbi:4Fe-4S dicluster domain-containing protein [Parvibacter caecicola]|uniref:4Fe-4S dicluster domain-containing protein n=1 Tax=Parvibacter caecicola TaxID=747645 RepID=UPI0023EFA44F|nr:4Fe-4S dicluster domain-containing protein [Parvibacter caecicola]